MGTSSGGAAIPRGSAPPAGPDAVAALIGSVVHELHTRGPDVARARLGEVEPELDAVLAPTDPARAMVACRLLAESGDHAGAAAVLATAVQAVAPDGPEAAALLTAQAGLHLMRGSVPAAEADVEAAAEALAAHPLDPGWPCVRRVRAAVLACRARVHEAEAVLTAELAAARADGDAHVEVSVLHLLGLVVHPRLGDTGAAETALREAVEVAAAAGLGHDVARARAGLALALQSAGQPEQAFRLAATALEAARRLGAVETEVVAGLAAGLALESLGEDDAALESCLDALARQVDLFSAPWRPELLMLQARLTRARCPIDSVRASTQALAAARRLGCSWTLVRSLLQSARLLLDDGDPAGADAALVAAQEFYEQDPDADVDPRARAGWFELRARVAVATGGHEPEAVLEALTLIDHLGAPVPFLFEAVVPAVAAGQVPAGALEDALRRRTDLAKQAASCLAQHESPVVVTCAATILAELDEPWAWAQLAALRDHEGLPAGAVAVLARAGACELPPLDLRLLGGCRVRHDGVESTEGWRSVQAKVLLAYLALEGPASPEDLVRLLWPEVGETADPAEKLQARLHSTVRLLRRALCPPWREQADYVVREGEHYRLTDAVPVTSDVEQLIRWAEVARSQNGGQRHACERVLDLRTGPLLGSVEHPWVAARRERLERLVVDVRERYARALLREREPGAAEQQALAVLAESPLRETAWRLRMLALDAQGRPAEALACYHDLVLALRDAAGMVPTSRTTRVAARIHAGHAPRA